MIVKIINFNSLTDPKCFIETQMDGETLNHAVAYLQIIRDQMPAFKIIDFELTEGEVKNLLISLYGCKDTSNADQPDYILDLFDNWNCYVMEADFKVIEQKAKREGVRSTMITEIIKTIEKRNVSPNYYAKKCLHILKQLQNFALDEEVIQFSDLIKGQNYRKLDVSEAYKQLARMIHYILDDIGVGIESKFLRISKCDDDGNPIGIVPPESGKWISNECCILDFEDIQSTNHHEKIIDTLKNITEVLSVSPPSLVDFSYVYRCIQLVIATLSPFLDAKISAGLL